MAVIWKGKGSVTLISVERTKEPNGSESFTWTYCGREAGIDGVFEAFKTDNPGSQTRRWHNDAVHFVSLTQTDTVVDSWTTTLEVVDKDLFSHPDVIAEAELYGTARYKREILEAVDKGEDLDSGILSLGTPSKAAQLYQDLSRGVTSYEDQYLVLKGQRLLPRNDTSRIISTSGPQPIYTTDQLFPAVPDDVLFRLPGSSGNPHPTAPVGTRWGWKKRGPTIGYAAWKADCSVEFVCAAWSYLAYPDDATGSFAF